MNKLVVLLLPFLFLFASHSRAQENLTDCCTFADFTSITAGVIGAGSFTFTMTTSAGMNDDGIVTWSSSYSLPAGFVNNSLPNNTREVNKIKETHSTLYSSKTITFSEDFPEGSYLFLEDIDVNEQVVITFRNAAGAVIDPSNTSDIAVHNTFNVSPPILSISNSTVNLSGMGGATGNKIVIIEAKSTLIRSIELEVRKFSQGNIGFFLSVPTTFVLPIRIHNFQADVQGLNRVDLNWETSYESNSDLFLIERSSNSLDWEEIGYRSSAGNSTETVNYSFVDYFPILGTSYYRLKQTDLEGEITYSPIISVQMESGDGGDLIIYPNSSINAILLQSKSAVVSDIQVFNTIGQNVTGSVVLSPKNNTLIEIDISNLPAGVYSIKTATTASRFYKD